MGFRTATFSPSTPFPAFEVNAEPTEKFDLKSVVPLLVSFFLTYGFFARRSEMLDSFLISIVKRSRV